MRAWMRLDVGFVRVNLHAEIFARVEKFYQNRKLSRWYERRHVSHQIRAEFTDRPMQRLTRERPVGDFAAHPIVGFFDDSWGKVVEFPALADLLSRRQRLSEHGFDLSPAPDFFEKARLEF